MEQHLLKTILDLFQSGNRLADMRKQLAALARPQAAQTIAEALRDLVSTRKGLKA
jgi:UDP-N-acetylglucosamine:LPS N-acetylglucosamine transferase